MRIRYIPGVGVPAGEAGAPVTGEPGTVPPGAPGTAAGQTAPVEATAPAPRTPPGIRSGWVREPRERRTRLQDRRTPSRRWPPPRE